MRKTLLIPAVPRSLALLLAGLAACSAHADETGRVIASTPIIEPVSVNRQVCSNVQVTTPEQKSGAGAVMGAIAGGAMGNAVGKGTGRALATGLGLLGGALLGHQIEGGTPPQTQTVQQCGIETVQENHVTGYQVTYEYAGKQYTTRMPSDPGPSVQLQIIPVMPPAPAMAPAPMEMTPVGVGYPLR